MWVDHTPSNLLRGPALLRMFPEARFIHLVRDGRGVAASILPLDWGPNDVMRAAEYWMARCAVGLAAELQLGPQRVLRVRYEDLLTSTETTLREIARFAGLDYEPEMARGRGHRPGHYHEQQHRFLLKDGDDLVLTTLGVVTLVPGYGLPPVGPWWFLPLIIHVYCLWAALGCIFPPFGNTGPACSFECLFRHGAGISFSAE